MHHNSNINNLQLQSFINTVPATFAPFADALQLNRVVKLFQQMLPLRAGPQLKHKFECNGNSRSAETPSSPWTDAQFNVIFYLTLKFWSFYTWLEMI